MKKFIPLMILAVFCLASCSAKNAQTNKEAGGNTDEQETVITGSVDKENNIVISGVKFKKDSEEFSEGSEGKVKEIADYLKDNTAVTMNVACYAAEDGTPAYCVDLSKKRAKKLTENLKKHGVSEDRIKYKDVNWNPDSVTEGPEESVDVELVH